MKPCSALSFWVLTVLGCGGVADDVLTAEPAPRVVRRTPGTASSSPNESSAAPAGANDEGVSAAIQPGEAEVSVEEPLDGEPYTTLLMRELAESCGACHGEEAVAAGSVQGGFGCVEDLVCGADLGFVIPLSSAQSPLIQLMRDQSMPPAGVQPRPTASLINAIANLIDNPLFWPAP